MTHDITTILEKAQNHLHLSKAEKARLDAHLHSILHPITPTTSSLNTPSPYTHRRIFTLRHVLLRVTAFVVVILLVTGSGIVTASEQALPGDSLYATKIALEDMKSTLKTTPDAKIAYAVERTEKRFDEVKTLARTGSLNSEKSAIVVQKIAEHTATVTDNAHDVAFTEPEKHKQVMEELKTTLAENTAELVDIQEEAQLDGEIQAVVDVVEEKIQEVTNIESLVEEVTAPSESAPVSNDIGTVTTVTTEESVPTNNILENTPLVPVSMTSSLPAESNEVRPLTINEIAGIRDAFNLEIQQLGPLGIDSEPLFNDLHNTFGLLAASIDAQNTDVAQKLIVKVDELLDQMFAMRGLVRGNQTSNSSSLPIMITPETVGPTETVVPTTIEISVLPPVTPEVSTPAVSTTTSAPALLRQKS